MSTKVFPVSKQEQCTPSSVEVPLEMPSEFWIILLAEVSVLCISKTVPNNAGLPYRPILIVGLLILNCLLVDLVCLQTIQITNISQRTQFEFGWVWTLEKDTFKDTHRHKQRCNQTWLWAQKLVRRQHFQNTMGKYSDMWMLLRSFKLWAQWPTHIHTILR